MTVTTNSLAQATAAEQIDFTGTEKRILHEQILPRAKKLADTDSGIAQRLNLTRQQYHHFKHGRLEKFSVDWLIKLADKVGLKLTISEG